MTLLVPIWIVCGGTILSNLVGKSPNLVERWQNSIACINRTCDGKSDLDRIGLSAIKCEGERISGRVQDCGEGVLLYLRRLSGHCMLPHFLFFIYLFFHS